MARHETVNVLGVDYELQSVSPQWYFEQNDRCGMTGSGTRDTARYMDILFKNVVVSPAAVTAKGWMAMAPMAAPRRAASSRLSPSRMALVKPTAKPSPAPTVSTTWST